MHVSFRSKCVIVSWRMIHTEEKKEGGVLVRRHVEKNFSHTIPLPEGTKVSDHLAFILSKTTSPKL